MSDLAPDRVDGADADAAYVEFVRARRPHLRRIAYACCGDWHRADDLVQTALVKLYVAWPRVRRDGREEAYARAIIVRADIDERRRPWRRERSTDTVPDRAPREHLPAEERSELFEALQRLPEMQRKTVLLRHWLGLSVRETAAELRIAEGTVKSHTSRALDALASALQPGPDADPDPELDRCEPNPRPPGPARLTLGR